MNALRSLRKEMQLTQVEAAQICGVSRRTFQTYEEKEENDKNYKALQTKLEEQKSIHGSRIIGLQYIKSKCIEVFKKYPEVECAYLYGSYARKEATPDSDVDILIICHNMGLSFFSLADDLNKSLGKEVDAQTVEQISDNTKIIENILVEGIKFYKKTR